MKIRLCWEDVFKKKRYLHDSVCNAANCNPIGFQFVFLEMRQIDHLHNFRLG